MDMTEAKQIVLFEEPGVRVTAPDWAIMELAYKDGIPSDWSSFLDERSILDATNGLAGPLKGDAFRAGALRYNLRPIVKQQKAGATPALFISPDGMTVKYLAVFSFNDQIFCDLTTLKFNNSKLWPRYLQTDYEYHLKVFR